MPSLAFERVVVVGGGFAGLAASAQLAQSGLPVTLLEAASLGSEASTRNQGWLHSGAWFAPEQVELARMCYEAMQQSLQFCPHCVEPDHQGMFFVASQMETNIRRWTDPWEAAGIPFEEIDQEEFFREVPGVNRELVRRVFVLPDRAFRPHVLLDELAAVARNAGAEIRTETRVVRLLKENGSVRGVVTARGEEIQACHVILATGALSEYDLLEEPEGEIAQPSHQLMALKTHLVAIQPDVSRMPFCFIDRHGFNHMPHEWTSVFNSGKWSVIRHAGDRTLDPHEVEALWSEIQLLLPDLKREALQSVKEWAGTTVQAMDVDQVEPGVAPRPTIVDHEEETGEQNVWSIYPGRATLWSALAEQVRQRLLTRLKREVQAPVPPPWAVSS